VKIFGIVGHNPETNGVDFDTRSRSQKVNIVLWTTSFKILVESRHKNY